VTSLLRPVAAPFVAAAPAGARVRARLRLLEEDEAVLRAVGGHLGSLAGKDLAVRCAEGRLDARGRTRSRTARKRALTAESSSRWAGAITRTSEDQVRLAGQDLRVCRASLLARIRRIQARLAVPAGGKSGRICGYGTAGERHAKTARLRSLQARLARVERRLETGTVSVVRGGKALLRVRNNLAATGLTQDQWRQQWESARLFLTADGEAAAACGNQTIRWHPDQGWLEIKLPAPLAQLANQPHGRYRLSRLVGFSYRGDEVAAQAASGAVRYDITFDPARGRWYLDASWKRAPAPVPSLGELRGRPVVAVDVNHGHLAAAVDAADGNVLGVPATMALRLAGLPSTTRDGHLRAAISALIATARARGARAIVIEDLDFAAARAEGRERAGRRPSRGRRGRDFRRAVSGIPTGKLRDRLVQMAANAGLSVIVIDPAYTSRWGAEYWLRPLREHHPEATGHHAAAVVIGRRGLGHRARRRATGNRTAPEDAARPAQARPRTTPTPETAPRKPAAPPGPRQPPGTKTGRPHRTTAGNQAAQDRSGPPPRQDHVLIAQQERLVALVAGVLQRDARHRGELGQALFQDRHVRVAGLVDLVDHLHERIGRVHIGRQGLRGHVRRLGTGRTHGHPLRQSGAVGEGHHGLSLPERGVELRASGQSRSGSDHRPGGEQAAAPVSRPDTDYIG
jgi:IS605 OrfB family transposase